MSISFWLLMTAIVFAVLTFIQQKKQDEELRVKDEKFNKAAEKAQNERENLQRTLDRVQEDYTSYREKADKYAQSLEEKISSLKSEPLLKIESAKIDNNGSLLIVVRNYGDSKVDKCSVVQALISFDNGMTKLGPKNVLRKEFKDIRKNSLFRQWIDIDKYIKHHPFGRVGFSYEFECVFKDMDGKEQNITFGPYDVLVFENAKRRYVQDVLDWKSEAIEH